MAEKLPRIGFKGHTTISLLTVGAVATADQPQALHTALSLITQLQAPGVELVLSDFTMSNALAAALSAAHAAGWDRISLFQLHWHPDTHIAPPLPSFHTLDLSEVLTNELLSTLQGCVTAVDTLRVMDSGLTQDVPAGTVLPWHVTGVKDAIIGQEWDLLDFLQQATHMGADTTTWALDDLQIAFDTQQVSAMQCMSVGGSVNIKQ